MPVKIDIRDRSLQVHGLGWRALTKKQSVGVVDKGLPPDLLQEEHHRAYGRPWILGRHYMDFLKSFGIKKTDRVLDFGCGAGRVGIWLLSFLDRGGYVGIDHDWDALYAFAEYEIPLFDLQDQDALLILDGSLVLSGLGKFDAILDFSVSNHLKFRERRKLYQQFASVLRPGGMIYKTQGLAFSKEDLREMELEVVKSIATDFKIGEVVLGKKTQWDLVAFNPSRS